MEIIVRFIFMSIAYLTIITMILFTGAAVIIPIIKIIKMIKNKKMNFDVIYTSINCLMFAAAIILVVLYELNREYTWMVFASLALFFLWMISFFVLVCTKNTDDANDNHFISMEQLIEHIKNNPILEWCVDTMPNECYFSMPLEDGTKVISTLIYNPKKEVSLIKKTETDLTETEIELLKSLDVDEDFISATKDLRYKVYLEVKKNKGYDLLQLESDFDSAFGGNIFRIISESGVYNFDTPLAYQYYIDNKTNSNLKETTTVCLFPKHGIVIIIELEDNESNKNEGKITFATVKNDKELIKTLIKVKEKQTNIDE